MMRPGARALLVAALAFGGAAHPASGEETGRGAARALFLEARQLERAGDHAAALERYRAAFHEDPVSRDLCFVLTERLKDAGDLEEALETGAACLGLPGDTLYTDHRLLGEIALRADDLAVALHHYRAAYALNPGDGDVLFMLAGLLEETGEQDSIYLEVLEALLPRLNYSPRLMDRALRAYALAGRVGELVPLLQAAWEQERHPHHGRVLAAWYDAEGLPLSVLGVARELAAIDPSPEHDWLLARAYHACDRPDSALVLFERLAKAHPDNSEIVHSLARVLFERGRYREARTAVLPLLRRDDFDRARVAFLAGAIDIELGRRGGEDLIREAAELEPDVPGYRSWLAYAEYVRGGRGARARAEEHLAPGSGAGLDEEGALWFEAMARGMLARDLVPAEPWERPRRFTDAAEARRHRRVAVERLEALLDRVEDPRTVLFELGAHLERLGERERSLAVLRRLVELDPDHTLGLNYLGYTLIEPDAPPAEDLAEAGPLIRRALELDPESGAYRDSWGWWHYRNGNLDSARVWLERALESMPHDAEVLAHLAEVALAQGDITAACGAWHALRSIDPRRDPMPECPEAPAQRGRRR